MKKGIIVLSIALLLACLAAMPVSAGGSGEPSPKPTPSPAPAPTVPAYIDVPTYYTQIASIPFTGNILVRMRITIRTWTSGGRREVVGSPSFDVTNLSAWPYSLIPLQPPTVERYSNLVIWSQYYQGIRIDGGYGSPYDPFRGMPPVVYAYPRVIFTY